MFASLFQNTKRKSPTRSARLAVECLEERAVMSTMAGHAGPALAAVWPPPPPAQAQVMEIHLGGGAHDDVSVAGTKRPGEEVPALCGGNASGEIILLGRHRPGEEVPALCGGSHGGDMGIILLGGIRPGSDVAGIPAVHATDDASTLGGALGGVTC